MIACCGLNCYQCEAYLATLEDSDDKRKETAHKWSKLYHAEILPEHINCDGCKSQGVKFFHCFQCEIRECCLSREVAHCSACEDYICDKLAAFIKLAPAAGQALERLRR